MCYLNVAPSLDVQRAAVGCRCSGSTLPWPLLSSGPRPSEAPRIVFAPPGRAGFTRSDGFRISRNATPPASPRTSAGAMTLRMQLTLASFRHCGPLWPRLPNPLSGMAAARRNKGPSGRSDLRNGLRAPSSRRRETAMVTSAERMRGLRERARWRVRRLTIDVSEHDLQALAERGYEGAARTDPIKHDADPLLLLDAGRRARRRRLGRRRHPKRNPVVKRESAIHRNGSSRYIPRKTIA
jgi:hypothetical protein